jgi:hypothetical protein
LLIFFLILILISVRTAKSPPALVAGGLVCFDLSGLLDQAMAVRRHGYPMMVVMNVIAAAQHLIETLREYRVQCQILVLRRWGGGARMKVCELEIDSRCWWSWLL